MKTKTANDLYAVVKDALRCQKRSKTCKTWRARERNASLYQDYLGIMTAKAADQMFAPEWQDARNEYLATVK